MQHSRLGGPEEVCDHAKRRPVPLSLEQGHLAVHLQLQTCSCRLCLAWRPMGLGAAWGYRGGP